jgi:MFS family permease
MDPVQDRRTSMKAALLTFVAVVLGLFVAFVLVVAVELFSSVVHPLPEDFGGTMEEMCRHVERYPQWVLAVVVAAWAVAALVSAWLAQRIGNSYSTVVVGLLLLAALVFNISQLPYPMWFKIANLFVIPTALVTGRRLSLRHKTAGTGEAKERYA